MPIPALSMSFEAKMHDKENDEQAKTPTAHASELNILPAQQSSHQGEKEGAKRRSLLPQPGQARYSTHQRDATAAATRTSTSIQPTASGRLRPRSLYQIGVTKPAHSRKEDETATHRSLCPPNATSKSVEPQNAGLSRSRSLRKPGAPTQSNLPAAIATHSRTQSTSSISGLQKGAVNARISSERPKSLLVAPKSNAKANGVSSDSASTASSASTRVIGMSRTASVKTRPESTGGGMSGRSVIRPEDPVGTQPRRREISKEETTKAARPAFTTLQQHFTPRKSGKAPTATFLQPAPAPEASSLPPETVNIQSELLQLHLLHEMSVEVSQQWERSARGVLRKRFEEVTSLHQAMLEYERTGQEQKNLRALFEWSVETSSVGLIECIHVLSGPLHELPSLVERGGRFQRLMGAFESWMLQVEEIWSDRLCSDGNLESIEGLGDAWKSENVSLIRKVTSFARDMDKLSQLSPGTSIASIVGTCKALLEGLSDELHVMQVIEADVVLKEKVWVEARLQAIAQDVGYQSVVVDRDAAAWRM